jgi:hypothetical protein
VETYYTILKVSESAAMEEIKKAYLNLAKTYHPDHNPGFVRAAEQEFKRINEAYQILSDCQKRLVYDAKLRYERRPKVTPPPPSPPRPEPTPPPKATKPPEPEPRVSPPRHEPPRPEPSARTAVPPTTGGHRPPKQMPNWIKATLRLASPALLVLAWLVGIFSKLVQSPPQLAPTPAMIYATPKTAVSENLPPGFSRVSLDLQMSSAEHWDAVAAMKAKYGSTDLTDQQIFQNLLYRFIRTSSAAPSRSMLDYPIGTSRISWEI